MSSHKQRLAIFDFDGTLINADSFPLFLKHATGILKYPILCVYFFIIFLSYKLKLFPAKKAKEMMLKCAIKGKTTQELDQLCQSFKAILNEKTNPQMMEKLLLHKTNGDKTIIVSASPTNWIKPWAEGNGIDMVIGASFEIIENKATGKLDGENCRGKAKVRYLKKQLPRFKEEYETFGYGDSIVGDKPLLDELDHGWIIK